MKKFSVIILGCFTLGISIWLLLPLFKPGFFITDDGEWMLIRFTAFHQALVQGQFPVRWVGRLNFEYGYSVINFLYPGYLYLAEVLHLVKIGFIDSIKIVLGVSLLSSGVFTFLWLRKFFSLLPAWVGGIVYILFPYHLYDMYHRGSVGEVLSLAILPFIMWQVERKSVFFSTLAIGYLILSHNTLALLFLPLIICYLFVRKTALPFSLKEISFILLGGLGVSAFFWLPALYELQYTIFSQTAISDWNKYFAPFILIGVLPLLAVILGSIQFLKEEKKEKIVILFGITLLLSLFLSSGVSSILWMYLPVSIIQFPFRFLSLSLLPLSYLLAYGLEKRKEIWQYSLAAGFILCALYFALPYAAPKEYILRDDMYYMTNEDSTTVKQEYTPTGVMKKPLTRPETPFFLEHRLMNPEKIEVLEQKSHKVTLKVTVENQSRVSYNHHFFPGWTGYVDGRKTEIQIVNETGIMSLPVSAGNHTVQFVFENTLIRFWSNILSLLMGILICIVSLRMRRVKIS